MMKKILLRLLTALAFVGALPVHAAGSGIVDKLFIQDGAGAVPISQTEKLRESMSVKDFGADETGAVNALTPFTNAYAAAQAGSTIKIPPGTYLGVSGVLAGAKIVYWEAQGVPTGGGAWTLPGVVLAQDAASAQTHTNGAAVSISNNLVNTMAGGVPGLKVSVSSAGSPANPASTDSVAVYSYITSENGRGRIWAENPIVDIPAGNEATAWAFEGNMNVGTANAPDPRSTNHKMGIDMVSGGGYAPSAAFATFSSTLANRWKHGLWFDNIGGQAGSSLIKSNVNVSVDYGLDIGSAAINYQGIRIGATPVAQVAAVGIRQLDNNGVGIFLQRNTDTASTGNLLQVTNAANNTVLAAIDVNGNYSTQGAITATGSIATGADFLAGGNSTANGIMQAQAFRATASAPTAAAGQISYGATTSTTVGAAGGATALPAAPLGYIVINVGGTFAKIPYYSN